MPSIKGVVRDEVNAPLDGATIRAHRLDTGVVLGESVTATITSGDTLESFIDLRLNLTAGFSDSSVNGYVLGTVGSPTIAPGWGVFNGADGALYGAPGATSGLLIGVNSAPELAVSGEFCIECWVAFSSASLSSNFLTLKNPISYDSFISFSRDGGNKNFSVYCSNSAHTLISEVNTALTGYTYHLALTCDSVGVLRIFIDGVMVSSKVTGTATPIVSTADSQWYFGSDGNSGVYLSDIRLTRGTSRYPTAGFAAPTEVFSPGVTALGAYEITTDYVGECYAVCIAPLDPVRNHSILRVVPG